MGPLGRTVTDVALIFQALPGPDPEDGLTGLIETLNATLEDNYTQYLRTDGLQVQAVFVQECLMLEALERYVYTAVIIHRMSLTKPASL